MSRIDRVNQQVKREISLILQRDLSDPRLEFVTITAVGVSRDLRYAKVHFSVIGDSARVKEATQGLQAARGLIRKLIGQRLMMRHTPELNFIHDQSLEISAQIDGVLEEIKNESKENHNGYQKE